MSKHSIAAGAIVALAAGPAAALTAEELWADWQALYAGMGASLSAESETYEGGRLQLDGITTSSSMGGVESSAEMGSVGLIEQADGSVLIDLPPFLEMVTRSTVDGQTTSQNVILETNGWSGVVTGDGVTRIYDIDAESQVIRFEDSNAEVPVNASITLSNIAADYTNADSNGTLTFDQTLTASGVSVMLANTTEPAMDVSWEMTDVASTAAGSFDLTDPSASPSLSQLGLIFAGEITHAGSTTSMAGMSDMGPFEFSGTAASGRIAFDIGEDALSYDIGSQGGEMALQLAAFPVPINATLSEVAMGLTMPVGASEDTKPFGLSVALRELAVDEQLWAMFDPTGQLPREPATVVIDLDGEAMMTTDIFGDPEAMMAASGPPGELRSLDLTELLVSIAGAELTGAGSATFANAGPIPQPVGSVTLNLTGAFALMDSLVALGFLPAEQAAMAKGMSGMVAEPVGEDALRSVIEFTEGGGITANGMPLQ